MLACIPSARDACEHDYSTFQQNVPSLVDVPASSQRFPNLTSMWCPLARLAMLRACINPLRIRTHDHFVVLT
jgi:hypothetical protein